MTPAEKLRSLRKGLGLTQQQVADRSKLSLTTIKWLEQGRSPFEKCRPLTIQALARALKVSVKELGKYCG